jgi:hypothetical protein
MATKTSFRTAAIRSASPALAARSAPTSSAAEAPVRSLLIIAPAAFHDSLRDFVEYKQSKLPTRLVDLEHVISTYHDGDDATRLKHYLYDEWRSTNHVGYVLLVGDVDVMPIRYMVLDRCTTPAFDYAFYGSDLYYADVAKPDGSFDDWNATKDGFHAQYIGEVRGDLTSRQTLCSQGQHDLVDTGQRALALLDDLRIERAIRIPGGPRSRRSRSR